MGSEKLEINYLAFNTPKNKHKLSILSQNLASLISFQLSQVTELKKCNIETFYNLSISEDLYPASKDFCLGCNQIGLNMISDSEDIIPVAQVRSIYNSFMKSNSDFVLFLDGDTVFLRSYINQLIEAVKNSKSDIAMAHECGSTGISPYANYNCGFILIRKNATTKLLMKSWLDLVTNNRNLAKHGNQRLFPHALGIANPKIFTVDNVYNLRCHPVYGNISQVWSPVYMVHNQDLSLYWSNKIKPLDSFFGEIVNKPSVIDLHAQIDCAFTPTNNPYLPRYVGGTLVNPND